MVTKSLIIMPRCVQHWTAPRTVRWLRRGWGYHDHRHGAAARTAAEGRLFSGRHEVVVADALVAAHVAFDRVLGAVVVVVVAATAPY